MKKKILIVDDHALVREGISALLRMQEDMEVLGEAANGKEAIEKTVQLRPDIILMDIAMPGLGGIETTFEIKKLYPDIKILILSQHDDSEYIGRLIKAGVSGYILKHALGTDLLSAIRAVARGEFYLYPSIASQVINGYLGKKEISDDIYEKLTDREKQIIKLLAEGNTAKEIANLLDISVKTVIAHQTNIYEKLNIHSRTEIIKFAIRRGIIKIDD